MADTYNGIWIGGYLRAPFYEYVDGTPLTFVNADPHQPSLPLAYGPKKVDLNEFKPPINELDIDACVHLTARNTWQRGTCSQLSPFICEYSGKILF